MAEPNHFYRPSDSAILSYELAPGSSIESHGRRLQINAHGIREDSDDLFRDHHRIAILGDSVIFGFRHDQAKTISAYVQEIVDPGVRRIKVFNFGLGGLNLAELVEFFRRHDATYDVDEVVFLLNPNDFAPRDSIYEGADNGLYRMYERPRWMGRWFVRKAIYRRAKNTGGLLGWYEWMFRGNRDWGMERLTEMAEAAREADANFGVVLLPSAHAFTEDGYLLEYLHAPVREHLDSIGVRYVDPTERFRADADRLYDHTDHFFDDGNVEMARVMLRLVRGPQPVSSQP